MRQICLHVNFIISWNHNGFTKFLEKYCQIKVGQTYFIQNQFIIYSKYQRYDKIYRFS